MRRHAVRLPVVATTEAVATVRSALWPIARLIHPLPRATAAVGNRPPVVLVHGYLGHPDMFRPLIRRLRKSGFPVVETVGYPSTRLRLDQIAERIDAVAAPLAERHGPVDLVGHSLGAVASRAWLKVFGGASRVRRFVSLGGPHAGTAMWRLTPPTLWDVLNPDGPWVHRLAEGPEPVPTTVIRSAYDHQVLPPVRAALPGVAEVVLQGYGHNGLLWARAAHLEVIRALD
ncbi:MAG: alpha/beta fold hydrolase [Alphaproteobacteria bacterium]|nr:alpha/beta fold hydrolase [Alphaproteobacteria bacterium]MCB9696421.1 alpha/beta fold hydrolase [Alphaproteobacteria bacterium]